MEEELEPRPSPNGSSSAAMGWAPCVWTVGLLGGWHRGAGVVQGQPILVHKEKGGGRKENRSCGDGCRMFTCACSVCDVLTSSVYGRTSFTLIAQG